jgi:hypothetical protein
MTSTQDLLIDIARRKERLAARSQFQRAAIAANFRELHGPIDVADRALGVARFLRAHPVLVAAAVAAVFVFRGRGVAGLAGRAYSAWRLWRTVTALVGPLLASRR